MWGAYADTSRWASWAPQIRHVEPVGPIEEGMRGRVDGPFFARAKFEVTSVDEAARRWSWRVAIGPAHLTIGHEVSEGATAVVIEGPAPLVLAYAPVARLALSRLVNLAEAG
jgi:Polyketide cyclase / dehydrase and lipid transport